MDKYISAKLDSFNFSKSQKELFVDIITYIAAKVANNGIDLSNFYTKTETDANINTAIQNLIGTAPEALDTLGEIAAKLNDNDDVVSTITNQITEINSNLNNKSYNYIIDSSKFSQLDTDSTHDEILSTIGNYNDLKSAAKNSKCNIVGRKTSDTGGQQYQFNVIVSGDLIVITKFDSTHYYKIEFNYENNIYSVVNTTTINIPQYISELKIDNTYVIPGDISNFKANNVPISTIIQNLGTFDAVYAAYEQNKKFMTKYDELIYISIDITFINLSYIDKDFNAHYINILHGEDEYRIVSKAKHIDLNGHDIKLNKLAPITEIYNFEQFDTIISNIELTSDQVKEMLQPVFWNISEAIYKHKLIICNTGNNSVISLSATAENDYNSNTTVNGVPEYSGFIHISGIKENELYTLDLLVNKNQIEGYDIRQTNNVISNIYNEIEKYHPNNDSEL